MSFVRLTFVAWWIAALAGCSSPGGPTDDAAVGDDAGASDDAFVGDDAAGDASGPTPDLMPECEWEGAPGTCLAASACGAIADHSAEPSPACATGTSCCIDTPDVADNPPIPTGWQLMQQSMVTTAMTNWAVAILHDPVTYPMFSTTTMTFGTQLVMARVEWHPPDFQNSVVHRGVTLYVPL
jgi:hypothetical protein